jgi:hypothetical protein
MTKNSTATATRSFSNYPSSGSIKRPRWTAQEQLDLLLFGLDKFCEMQDRHTRQASLIRQGQLRAQVEQARHS